RQHPLHGEPDDLLGTPLEHVVQRARAQAARIAGAAVVALLPALVARHGDLFGVDDDHEVADVAVRRELRLALAPQRVGDLRGEPPERLAGRVDHEPVSLARRRCRYIGLHLSSRAATRLAGASSRARPPPRGAHLATRGLSISGAHTSAIRQALVSRPPEPRAGPSDGSAVLGAYIAHNSANP